MGGLLDLFYSYLALIVILPILGVVLILMKIFFYKSLLSTELKVSSKTKKYVTIVIMIVSLPISSYLIVELFLYFSGRTSPAELYDKTLYTITYITAGLPGLINSIITASKKIKKIEVLRNQTA